MEEKQKVALEAIQKKLLGKKLTYKEIYAIMDQIAEDRLGDILTTYFVASGYSNGFTDEEIYYLTKAMIETGETLEFEGTVADKHSIGGSPGTRTTMIVVPIIAAAGFKIPKSSSRAITTPAGTADVMEVLANVTFSKEKIHKIVEKTNGCIVWGGSFKIAPADDEIIRIEEPLMFESFDKILVSIMAKKIAFGSTHVVIDLPYGKTMKVHRREDAEVLRKKFEFLADKFNIAMKVLVHKIDEPAGRGVGPLLEAREVLWVLEQHEKRSQDLEEKSIQLAKELLDLCLQDAKKEVQQEIAERYVDTEDWARHLLSSGAAHTKMMEIIGAQGGDPKVKSSDLKLDKFAYDVEHEGPSGVITHVHNKNVSLTAKILGAPEDKKAGIFLHKKVGDRVKRGEVLCTLYAQTKYKLKETVDSLEILPLFSIEKG